MEGDGDSRKSQKSKRGDLGSFRRRLLRVCLLSCFYFNEQLVAVENQNTTFKAGRQEAAEIRAQSLHIQTMDEADIKRINSIAAFLSRQISSSFPPTPSRPPTRPTRPD